MRQLLVIYTLLGVGVGRAQGLAPNEQEAQKLLADGVRAMDAGHLQEAHDLFTRARELVPMAPNPYRLLGVVDFRLAKCAESVDELEKFLGMVGPNDRRVTEVASMRDKCKDELTPKVGTLSVESNPTGAEVRLDDEKGPVAGTTPYKNASLSAGAHVVYLHKNGFKAAFRGFTIQKNEKLRIDLTLPKEEIVAAGPEKKPVYKKGWFWGVVVVAVVVVGAGVGVGAYYGTRPTTATFNTTLPAFSLGLTGR